MRTLKPGGRAEGKQYAMPGNSMKWTQFLLVLFFSKQDTKTFLTHGQDTRLECGRNRLKYFLPITLQMKNYHMQESKTNVYIDHAGNYMATDN